MGSGSLRFGQYSRISGALETGGSFRTMQLEMA